MKLLTSLGAFLLLAVGSVQPHAAVLEGVRVQGATADVSERVEWAAGRFAAAGLELPEIEMYIHSDDAVCHGADGLTRMSGRPIRIDVCNPHRLILLHELAHAWDAVALDDTTRRAFMEILGLGVWNDRSVPWKERGVERLAEVMVWGLHETGRPDDSNRTGYSLLTGAEPLWSGNEG